MSRDSNGNYTLPAGNPVVTGEVISTGWANPTMSDIGEELTNSLDRQGRGGMLAPFKFVDGTNSQPGITWTSEPTTGFYRAGASDMRATVAGVARMRWTGTGVDVYDSLAGTWVALSSATGIAFLPATGGTMSGALTISANSRGLKLYNNQPSVTFNDLDGTANQRVFDLLQNSNVISLRALNDALDTARDAMVVTGRTDATGIASIVFGNTTDYPTFTAHSLKSFFGGTVSPTVSATRQLGLYGGSGRIELGLHMDDATSKPRAALFADDAANVGLNYTFTSGVTRFQFAHAGTEVFSYAAAGARLVNAKYLFGTKADGSTAVRLTGLDASDNVYFGSDTLLTSYIFGSANGGAGTTLRFRTANTDRFTITDSAVNSALPLQQGGVAVVLTNDARMTNARTPTAHTHAAADVNSGVLATARLGSGTANSSTYLRGDSTWATVPTGGISDAPSDTFPYVRKDAAWLKTYGTIQALCSFNGSTMAVAYSKNVSSVTDDNTGSYALNFTAALATAAYIWSGCGGTPAGGNTMTCSQSQFSASSSTKTTTVFGFNTLQGQDTQTRFDCVSINIGVYL